MDVSITTPIEALFDERATGNKTAMSSQSKNMSQYQHIANYRTELQRLRTFGGSDNEQNIRRAFEICLSAYCKEHHDNLELVPELALLSGVKPDGTVKDVLRMTRGYWEAKDTHDDLDAEVQKKLDQGYPRDNIVFEDSLQAVLIQNGRVAMRIDMGQTGTLHRLIQAFLNYELPELEDFRSAQRQFKADLPEVLRNLRAAIEEAKETNEDYRNAALEFLSLCKQSIGPAVNAEDVQEMLLQHILTKDIFLRVFAEDQFHRENNIALQLDALERTFFTGNVRRQAIDNLRSYYAAIGRAADDIADYTEKQQFLKAIYEDFYTAYNPRAADRLGVVYTPNEIVDFIIRGSEWLLQEHFGRSLGDANVRILDPATGTGTFITNLINFLPVDRLEWKYKNEIFANEVAILPYYIANLNIEYTYKERTGEYEEFPNLSFVDTLDNMGWVGKSVSSDTLQDQGEMFIGGLSEENLARVRRQNETPISVIIGNPPYNDSQSNWNERNPNRTYFAVDKRIRETYIKEGTAQRTHQYDMYKRFLRWASDRLDNDGIVGFITNRRYIDAQQDDGFRRVVTREFGNVYIVDLGGDVRKSGRVGNVFGIMTGVAICFLVRDAERAATDRIHYYALKDEMSGPEKLSGLEAFKFDEVPFERITPDEKSDWINQSTSNFHTLIPAANRETKFAKDTKNEGAVFRLFTNGVKSNRDEWVYDLDLQNLRQKVLFFADSYNDAVANQEEELSTVIKWSRDLRNELRRHKRIVYDEHRLTQSLYRPFITKLHFADSTMNDVLTRNHYAMFGRSLNDENRVICFQSTGARRPFSTLATNKISDFHLFFDGAQCLPLYRYTPDGKRVSNITDWGLRQFREHYGDDNINAEQVFAYTYAVLHDPTYRRKYATDLLREFPRLPFYDDFEFWSQSGQELLDLHTGFESVEQYGLNVEGQSGEAKRVLLRADKERGIIHLDDASWISGVPDSAWRYMLGTRSAMDWVLDQYKERKPRDPTIASRFNTYRFADHKERVIDLLQRVCTVSVRTMELVDEMERFGRD